MFPAILKDLRKSKRVTQIELAAAIGVSPGNVGDWETGKSCPSYNALIALSKFFEVSADVLLGLRDSGEPPADSRGLAEREAKLIAMVRTLDHRDREELFDLAEIKLKRAIS